MVYYIFLRGLGITEVNYVMAAKYLQEQVVGGSR